jgi:hypothetical protein
LQGNSENITANTVKLCVRHGTSLTKRKNAQRRRAETYPTTKRHGTGTFRLSVRTWSGGEAAVWPVR